MIPSKDFLLTSGQAHQPLHYEWAGIHHTVDLTANTPSSNLFT